MNKMYRGLKVTLGSGLVILAGGCASIVSGTSQTIYVQAVDSGNNQPIPSAKCVVKDSKGNLYPVNGNPGSVVMGKGQGALQTECKAAGYAQGAVGTGQSFDAWTIGNIIFWPGIIVDAVTGAIQKYPDHVTVLMAKKG